ncbi:hypothetical protein LUU34_00239000 [Aix galericulata]|nr:hypothetical protein LUU34_00239000 [Aix galericulata]
MLIDCHQEGGWERMDNRNRCQCAITMMMVKLPQSFYVMSVGICVQIVTDSYISIGEQKLIRDRYSKKKKKLSKLIFMRVVVGPSFSG